MNFGFVPFTRAAQFITEEEDPPARAGEIGEVLAGQSGVRGGSALPIPGLFGDTGRSRAPA